MSVDLCLPLMFCWNKNGYWYCLLIWSNYIFMSSQIPQEKYTQYLCLWTLKGSQLVKLSVSEYLNVGWISVILASDRKSAESQHLFCTITDPGSSLALEGTGCFINWLGLIKFHIMFPNSLCGHTTRTTQKHKNTMQSADLKSVLFFSKLYKPLWHLIHLIYRCQYWCSGSE